MKEVKYTPSTYAPLLEAGKKYRLIMSDCCIVGELVATFLRLEAEDYDDDDYPDLVFDIGRISEFAAIKFEEVDADEANARLIAAAPEMYEALSECIPALSYMIRHGKEDYIDWNKRMDCAIAALALADGKGGSDV